MNVNNLELNQGDDFIIGLDISASMQATDCPGGATRIKYCIEQFGVFAQEAAKFDTDGVSLYAFGASVYAFPDIAADKIAETITKLTKMPLEGMTNTAGAIEAAYKEHKERANEQTTLMLFTDGAPSDEAAVFRTIARITNEVKDEREFNVSILTVGQRTSALEAFLTKLDDGVPGAKYDIVDVKKIEDVDFYKAFDGALND